MLKVTEPSYPGSTTMSSHEVDQHPDAEDQQRDWTVPRPGDLHRPFGTGRGPTRPSGEMYCSVADSPSDGPSDGAVRQSTATDANKSMSALPQLPEIALLFVDGGVTVTVARRVRPATFPVISPAWNRWDGLRS